MGGSIRSRAPLGLLVGREVSFVGCPLLATCGVEALIELLPVIFSSSSKVGTVLPIPEMRKLRLGQVMHISLGHKLHGFQDP